MIFKISSTALCFIQIFREKSGVQFRFEVGNGRKLAKLDINNTFFKKHTSIKEKLSLAVVIVRGACHHL